MPKQPKPKAYSYPVKIRRQKRKTIMIRPIPGYLEVFIPTYADPNDPQVQRFISSYLKKNRGRLPQAPTEQTPRDDILQMVAHYAGLMNLHPKRVTLREMHRRWGSCTERATVTLNTRLSWLPRHIVEYVVCHELAHLQELNHGPQFWALVALHMPDYAQREAELREIEKTFWQ
jgi:hypothetical protein